jgi:hypothetical protein
VSKNSNLQVMKIDNLSKDISFFPVEVDNLYINIRIHNGSGTQTSLVMDEPPMAHIAILIPWLNFDLNVTLDIRSESTIMNDHLY